MKKVTIWHNPKCSKSREALSILEGYECDKDIIKYLETSPEKNEIKNLLKMLGVTARELMRTKEELYKELALKEEHDEEKLIEAMAQNPKLIERPILIKDGKAIIGRPTSVVAEFLEK
ncbi:MAG: arsenate reductase (glutaredoxin) [Epsilonproteobacteria bacterium]|nr:arsenate reductase (glutaredoxin) [Campylobacterota bacterium]OIO16258.1 MAG: arsenate reductase (glutaredoxin) [Helicobacteraceae bacterium CG1_02_36_14]PIP09452.1 MAG: arsenate reductase (glutaredoxin) [Sulfurimonas sp. CG23_combo_of_CG06-09_8_20_14_all_36_33]PIS24575.1 MAG: arsenate reductase (glutaredoxin) [Sulfurimonas sp. CG08_land_8_20_14_0_20_36_33]PIU35780.1 MAG: arsenate reductase (glutaredoxin) [Sulfurimonas sp. CG07_land_8_20_14_0_80_36_56]PIV05057.1 MAG: arsenate reductase (glu